MQNYTFPALAPEALIERWRSQGLAVPDISRAIRHLKAVGYHRLNRYARFFRATPGSFKAGVSYDDIWIAYVFDRKLRLLTLDAVERIEVAVRTAMSDSLSLRHGPHWFMDATLFRHTGYAITFQTVIAEATRKARPPHQTPEASWYYRNYAAPSLPPSWIVMEHLSMGEWSKALPMLVRYEQKCIATAFGLPPNLLTSWVSSLALVRNVCAHHGMLWNRVNTRLPELPKKPPRFCPDFSLAAGDYYATACILQYFLKRVVRASTWSRRLKELLSGFSADYAKSLGFPNDWDKNDFWNYLEPRQ